MWLCTFIGFSSYDDDDDDDDDKKYLERLWGPPSLLSNGCQRLFTRS
jgi:hypothetical protein